MLTRTLAAALLLSTVLAAPAALAAPPAFVPGELLVKFRTGTSVQARAAAVAGHAHAEVADLDRGWTHVRLRKGETVEAALAEYASNPEVENAQPNFVYRATLVSTEPLYGQEWALKNRGQAVTAPLQPPDGYYSGYAGTSGADIDVEPAWSVTTDCRGVVVAVIDTGVNYQHQDLAANMWDGGGTYPNHGYDFVTNDNNPFDEHGHGTHVSGIIAADGTNGLGAVGVCWRARIMALRALDQFGSGSTATIIPAINFAVQHGAKVVNMSLGGGGSFDAAYSDAITAGQNADVLFVVAAGNETSNVETTPSYPCSFTQPNILCVAALDQNFGLASFSNYGSTSVDVGAPGTDIVATWPGTRTATTEQYANAGDWSATPYGGWGIDTSTNPPVLTVPADYTTNPSAVYAAGTDYRAWKTFNTAGASIISVDLQAIINVTAGDTVRVACRATGGDPFAAPDAGEQDSSGAATYPNFVPLSFDMTPCASATSTLGFGLVTRSGTTPTFGIALAPFTVKALTWNTTSYHTISGTSMATPVVAGVAALLRSYNPQFTYSDTFDAIVNGGATTSALAGKTTSGKAVKAMGALARIRTPTGLRWTEK